MTTPPPPPPTGPAGAGYAGQRFTPQVAFACLIGASTGLLMGYENGIAGGVAAIPGFQQRFFPHIAAATGKAAEAGAAARGSSSAFCAYDDPILQLFLSSVYLASVLGAIAGSITTPRLGRRFTMIAAAICFTIGALVQAAAVHVSMIVIGRVLLGLGMGAADQVGPQMVSEMAPYWLRGRLASVFQLQIIIGFFCSSLINFGTAGLAPDLGWRLALGLAAAPSLLLLAGAGALPDTPAALAERGRPEEALAVLRVIRGTDDVAAEFDDICAAAASAASHRQWASILSRRRRPQLLLSTLIPVFQVLAGFQAVIFAPQLFEALGAGHADALKNTVIIGLVFVAFTLVAVALADSPRAGRRALLQTSGAVCAAAMFTLAGLVGAYASHAPALNGGGGGDDLALGVLVVVCVYVAGFSWGWGPMAWLAPSELTPLDARAAGSALAVISNHLACFALAQGFMSLLCALRWGLFLFFGAWLVVSLAFVHFLLPESKGVPLESVHLLFESHWAWKRLLPPGGGGGGEGGAAGAKVEG